MLSLRTISLALIACAGLHAQCVPGGLAVVVPKTNPANSLSMAQLRKLVMGDVHTWPDKNKVMLVSTASEGAVFKCVLTSVVRMTPPEYKKYVMSAEFRGDEPAHVRVVDSSAAAVRTGSRLRRILFRSGSKVSGRPRGIRKGAQHQREADWRTGISLVGTIREENPEIRMKPTIRNKLLAGFSGVLMLMAAVAGIGIYSVFRLRKSRCTILRRRSA
jgi:hypothetical protein